MIDNSFGLLEVMMPKDYDVAISFIAQDEGLANELRDALQPPLNVFVYSKRQEELSGKDGIEAFRTVFRDQAQLVVVLFRPPWGETPWTRVEKTAIEELCLDEGWEHLMLVRLEDAPVPKWVPKPHLYLDLRRFTLADLAGAIKARLVELGVEIRIPSAAERAAAMARQEAFDEETVRLIRGPRVVDDAQQALFESVAEVAARVATETGWAVSVGEGYYIGGLIIATRGISLQLSVQRRRGDDVVVEVVSYNITWPIAEHGKTYGITEEHLRSRSPVTNLKLARLPDLGWCWEMDGRVVPPAAAAEAIVDKLLDLVARKRNRW